jgi:hypothetical protein
MDDEKVEESPPEIPLRDSETKERLVLKIIGGSPFGEVAGTYDPAKSLALISQLFSDFITPESKAEALERATKLLLVQVHQKFNEALFELCHEVFAQVMLEAGGFDYPRKKVIEDVLRLADPLKKQRMGGLSNGRPAKITHAKVVRAFRLTATKKIAIASTLGCTEQGLDRWYQREGFNSWAEVIKHFKNTK